MSASGGVPPDTGQAWRSSRADRVRETREAAGAGMSRRRLFRLIGLGVAAVGVSGGAAAGGAFLSGRLGRQETSAVSPAPAVSEISPDIVVSTLPMPSEQFVPIAPIGKPARTGPTLEMAGSGEATPTRVAPASELDEPTGVIDEPAVVVAEAPPAISVVGLSPEPIDSTPLFLDYTLPENARLVIPAIDVNAPVKPFGVDEFGRMEAPDRPEEVGWFELGPLPGTAGNSILTGHVDWYDGSIGVFAGLRYLAADEVVEFTDPRGVIASYRVLWQRSYVADKAPINEILGQNVNLREMTMITCGGTFDAVQRNYSHRLIVRCEAR